MIRSLLCFATILLVTSTALGGTTYYVAKNGNDTTGDGSSGSPWKTIQKGVNALSAGAGDTLIVRDGVYSDENAGTVDTTNTVQIPYSARGTSGAWTTIKAENPGGAVLHGYLGVDIENDTDVNNYIAKGFNFAAGVSANSPNGYVRIEGFKIEHYHNKAISMNQPFIYHVYIYNVEITNTGIDTWDGNIDTYDPTLGCARWITIDSCILHDCDLPWGKNYVNQTTGYVFRSWRYFFYFRATDLVVINCLFYNMPFTPITCTSKSGGYRGPGNYWIVNNVFFLTDPGAPWSQGGGYSETWFGAIQIRMPYAWVYNNIIVAPPGKESVGGAIHFYKSYSGLIDNVYLRNNITTCDNIWDVHDNVNPHLVGDVPTASTNNVVSEVVGDIFTGTGLPTSDVNDYKLKAGSPAIDAGRLLSIPVYYNTSGPLLHDYLYTNVRPDSELYDVGMWEYIQGDPGPVQTSGSMTFYPTKDAYIDSSAQTSNYGGFAYSAIRYDVTKQLRDLALFDFSALPADYTITSAKIHKYFYYETGNGSIVGKTAYMKRLTRTDWVEGNNTAGTGVDWLEWAADGGGSWSAGGGDFVDTYEASFVLTGVGTTHIYDVTEMAQWCGTNTSELLSVINLYTSSTGVSHVPWFRTKEHATASERIKLVIDYTIPDTGVPTEPPPPNRWGRLFRVFGF